VAVIEFSDFQCPYCALFARRTFPELLSRYVETGRVLFVFRNLPLDRIHPDALRAAEAAECAHRQGKFWEMHDRLFADPRRLGIEELEVRAINIGLDTPTFKRCFGGAGTVRVRQDLSSGRQMGLSSTPVFFIGRSLGGEVTVTHRVAGAQPLEAFASILDSLLAEAAR
jgi:protein-disulfide isomerase